MKTKSKIPALRFKGFTDAWEQRKFPEFVEFYNGLTYSPDDVRASGTLVLRSSNVKNGEIVDADNVYVEPDKATSENVKEGDIIVVVRNGSRALIGKHAEIKESMSNTVIGAFMSGIRSEHSSFVNALLDTNQFEKEIEKNMGATINQITGYMFSKMEFTIPSPTEQDKIGNYFKYLDHLITLHQRKLFEAKNNPKNGSKNFFRKIYQKLYKFDFNFKTYDWEQRKLGDVFDERSERASGNEELLSVTISNGVIRQIDSEKRNIASEDKSNYKVVKKGDVPYNSMRMWQGAVGTSDYDGIVSPAYTVLIPKNNCNGKFFMELFKKQPTLEIFKRWSQGLTSDTWNLKYPVLSTIPFMVPSVKEQEKIAEYFKSLDNLITLHQREVFYTLKHIFYRCCDTLLSGGL